MASNDDAPLAPAVPLGADVTPARALGLSLLALFAFLVILSLGYSLRGHETADPWNEALALAAGFPLAIVLGMIRYGGGRSALDLLGLRYSALPAALIALVLGFSLSLVVSELENLTRLLIPYPSPLQSTSAVRSFAGEAVAGGVVFPLTSELFFRGLLVRGLVGRVGPWRAILWGAFLGAGMTSLGAYSYLPGQFLFGVLSGWLVVLTGSVLPSLAAALGCFAMPFLLTARGILLSGYNRAAQEVQHVPGPLLLGGGVVSLLCLLALAAFGRRTPGRPQA